MKKIAQYSYEEKNLSAIWSSIMDMDVTHIQKELVSKYGWSEEDALRCHRLYKQYLYLQMEYGKQYILPPSLAIDEFWHLHILDTQCYTNHCTNIFGYYLHHLPSYAQSNIGKDDIDYKKEFDITKSLFLKVFNEKL